MHNKKNLSIKDEVIEKKKTWNWFIQSNSNSIILKKPARKTHTTTKSTSNTNATNKYDSLEPLNHYHGGAMLDATSSLTKTSPKKESPLGGGGNNDHEAPEPQFSLRPASTKTNNSSSSKPTSRPSSPVNFPKIGHHHIGNGNVKGSHSKESLNDTQNKSITSGWFCFIFILWRIDCCLMILISKI